MTSKKEPIERRQQKRFRAKDGALIMLKPLDTGVGRLIDISAGGCTFEHLSSQRTPFEATAMDIILTGTGFALYNLPCRSIWNLTIYEKPETPLYNTRFGVKFGELTSDQMRLVKYFIQNHTQGEA